MSTFTGFTGRQDAVHSLIFQSSTCPICHVSCQISAMHYWCSADSVAVRPARKNLLKSSSQTQNVGLNSTRPESTSGNRGPAFPAAEPFPNHSAEAQEPAAESSTGSDQLSSKIGADPGLQHSSAESAESVQETCILQDSSKNPSQKKVAVGSMADVVVRAVSDCSKMNSPQEPEHQASRRQSMRENQTAMLQTRIAELQALVEELQQIILLGCQERAQLQNQLQQTAATIPIRQQVGRSPSDVYPFPDSSRSCLMKLDRHRSEQHDHVHRPRKRA